MTFVCEWTAYGIAARRLALDGRRFAEAAAAATAVWSDEGAHQGPHSQRHGYMRYQGWAPLVAEGDDDPEV